MWSYALTYHIWSTLSKLEGYEQISLFSEEICFYFLIKYVIVYGCSCARVFVNSHLIWLWSYTGICDCIWCGHKHGVCKFTFWSVTLILSAIVVLSVIKSGNGKGLGDSAPRTAVKKRGSNSGCSAAQPRTKSAPPTLALTQGKATMAWGFWGLC